MEACNEETDLSIAANILLNMFLARTTRYLRSMLLTEAEVANIRQAAVPDTTVDLLGAMMAQYEEARRAHTPPAVDDAPDPPSRLASYHAALDTWRASGDDRPHLAHLLFPDADRRLDSYRDVLKKWRVLANRGQSLPDQTHLAFLGPLSDYLSAKTLLDFAEVTEIRRALSNVDPDCPPFNYLLDLRSCCAAARKALDPGPLLATRTDRH